MYWEVLWLWGAMVGHWWTTGHESLDNVTPADVYTGRAATIIKNRQRIKERTMKLRNQTYKKAIARAQTMS